MLHFLSTGKGKPSYLLVMPFEGPKTPQGIVQPIGLQDGGQRQGFIIYPCLAKESEQGAPAIGARLMLADLT
jgi:hypothetical protein